MQLMRVEKKNGFNIIYLSGRLDIAVVEEIETHLNKLVEQGEINFIFDLSEVMYFSSSAMRILISLKRKVDDKEGKLRLCQINKMVDKIMSALELFKIFETYASVEEALNAG